MAEEANVKVQNDSTRGTINVSRELSGGAPDYENTIPTGDSDTIFLQGPEVSLIINSPGGVSTQECTITVESEQEMSCNQYDFRWVLNIVPGGPPEVPAYVNVTVSDVG